MIDKAQKDNIKLSVVSAFRSYQRQKQIWENKWEIAQMMILIMPKIS